uniref:Gnk2-homologous domain-containing protein n=1 Tax=Glycine max TaxID=3847 RepID=A0A0R0EAY3_SOYBN
MAAPAIVSKTLLLFLILHAILMSLATSQPNFVKHYCFDQNGNYTANSQPQCPFVSNLSSNTEIDYGFYNFSNGQNSDKVNVIGMCRGDLKPEACRSCLNNSRILLTQLFQTRRRQLGGMISACCATLLSQYLELLILLLCMISACCATLLYNQNETNVDQILGNRAAAGDSHRMYAQANKTGPSFQTVFAHVQCTPDLLELECNQCLFGNLISYIPKCRQF